jgi:hypothetical protein
MASLFGRNRWIVSSRRVVYVTGLLPLMMLISARAVWLFERALSE